MCVVAEMGRGKVYFVHESGEGGQERFVSHGCAFGIVSGEGQLGVMAWASAV